MKKHILLIENDETKLDFFSDALEESNLDFVCSRARNVVQAARILKSVTPDIIFVGMNLPKLSGLEFLKKIKNMDCFKFTPVVLYSSMADQKIKEEVHCNASDYILLPASVITMAAILKNFFNGVKEISYSNNIELNFYE
jgi:DNA-binding NtrC family response regulator